MPTSRDAVWTRFAAIAVLAGAVISRGDDLGPPNALGLRLPPHFHATEFAGPELAPNIYAMTLDAKGRVVVTGPGYIRRLEDTGRHGKADKATLFAATKSGGMGLCFNGNDLIFFGDGALWRYADTNGDGIADGPPVKIAPFAYGEHGAHAIRQGPDGSWYLLGGNDAGFSKTPASSSDSPVRQAEAGALLRFSADGATREILANGFRNPYDFDFNPYGDVFTLDSDAEADYFLPWYTPIRLFHVAMGGHHGWRLPGYTRSWNRPAYSPDTTDILVEVGRGSPTGLVCYRHFQFPERYWNGVFACDWTFGRIYFFPLEFDDGEYHSQAQVFLEAAGSQGFAPTDIVVAPDGSLYVSTGGRQTRGAVYHIEYTGPKSFHVPSITAPVDAVIKAPQPLDAWSRARWMPLAAKLGAGAFAKIAEGSSYWPQQRVRAVEVLTEMFGGLGAAAKLAARNESPLVRGRVAWSLGRQPAPAALNLLLELAVDPDPYVSRCALEAIAEHQSQVQPSMLPTAIAASLESPDKRLRQTGARIAARLAATEWKTLWSSRESFSPQGQLSLVLASIWRNPGPQVHVEEAAAALAAAEKVAANDLRLQAVRLVILALGDYNLDHPSAEAFTGYEFPFRLTGLESLATRALNDIHSFFPTNNAALNIETTRLMAMLGDPDPSVPGEVLRLITRDSSATADFHALVVLARLEPSLDAEGQRRLALGIERLDRKLRDRQARIKQNWSQRLVEVTRELIARYPGLADELLAGAEFPTPSHLPLVDAFDAAHRRRAADVYLMTARQNPGFVWSRPLLDLFGLEPVESLRPLLREQWGNVSLRDEILLRLSQKPQENDRERFMQGLESGGPAATLASATALLALQRDLAPLDLAGFVRAVERQTQFPPQKEVRAKVLALLEREAGKAFSIHEQGRDPAGLAEDYLPVKTWFTNAYPRLAKRIEIEAPESSKTLQATLKEVKPEAGDVFRGRELFEKRGCQGCHAAPDAIGPDLSGAASRMSVEDLFTAIVFPSKDIAPAYIPETFQLRDGQSHSGFVAFESADGVIIRTGTSQTVRLASDDILSRRPGRVSLMPTGLLDGLKPGDWADLYAYLRSLSEKSAPAKHP
jgi:putative membrane-bound dehydrogenase-like protein